MCLKEFEFSPLTLRRCPFPIARCRISADADSRSIQIAVTMKKAVELPSERNAQAGTRVASAGNRADGGNATRRQSGSSPTDSGKISLNVAAISSTLASKNVARRRLSLSRR